MPRVMLVVLLAVSMGTAVSLAGQIRSSSEPPALDTARMEQQEQAGVEPVPSPLVGADEESAGAAAVTEKADETGPAADAEYVPAAPAAEENQDAAALPESPKRYYTGEGIPVPRDWKCDGAIIGEKDKKFLISQGDTVYLNLGSDRVRPGTRLMVYRKLEALRDPEAGDVLGYEVRRIGRLEVTNSIEQTASTAKVIVSYEPIQTGDLVKILTED